MNPRNDRNTLTEGRHIPPSGDRLVYVPIDALPRELLGKFADYKVIVKDDLAGERIHPKERLDDVLADISRNTREGSGSALTLSDGASPCRTERLGNKSPPPSSPDTTENLLKHKYSGVGNFPPRTPPQSHYPSPRREIEESPWVEQFRTGGLRNRHSDEQTYRYIDTRSFDTMRFQSGEDVIFSSQRHAPYDVGQTDICTESTSDVRTNEGVTMDMSHDARERVTMEMSHDATERVTKEMLHDGLKLQTFLETTPRKEVYQGRESRDQFLGKSPYSSDRRLVRSDSYREQPTPFHTSSIENGPGCYSVERAKKQLFRPSLSKPCGKQQPFYEDESDFSKENKFHGPHSPRRHLERDEFGSPHRAYISMSSLRGLKRKRMLPETGDFPHYHQRLVSDDNGTLSTNGISGRLLDILQPSKRQCFEKTDIGPTRKSSGNCPCAMMESHFLQMTECAYRNIRRKDSSTASFEQFKRELTQTNSVLKESVNILRAVQQMCSHRDQADR